MRGLLGRASLPEGEALFIPACGAVHTFFMRFNLDILFMDRDMAVRRIAWNVPPWRLVFGGLSACHTIEARSGWLSKADVRAGMNVAFRTGDAEAGELSSDDGSSNDAEYQGKS